MILAAVMVVSVGLCSLPAQGKYGGGKGTPAEPYLIYDANQMNAIGGDKADWDKHFRVMADIDLGTLTGMQFNVIGRRIDDEFPRPPLVETFQWEF